MDNNLLDMITDPHEQVRKLENEDVLCLMLRNDLRPISMYKLARSYFLILLSYEGEDRFGVVWGMIQDSALPNRMESKKFIDDIWGEREYESDEESIVFETFLEKPCCFLLQEDLNAMQMMSLKYTYHIIDIDHEGKQREAIACAIYNKKDSEHVEREPKVLSQFQQLN